MMNSQDNCQLTDKDVPFVTKPKHPGHIIVFGVTISDGDYILPFIFRHRFKLNINGIINKSNIAKLSKEKNKVIA